MAPSLFSAGGRPPVPSHLKDADVIWEELRHLVTEEHREVITVGHSYGAFVVTESIRGFEDFRVGQGGVIHCLVMSAFIGCKGDSVMSLLDHKMPEFLELDPENPAYILVKGVKTAFFNDVDPDVASSRIAVAQPHSYATFNSAAEDPCWTPVPDDNGKEHRLPLTYLIFSNDQGTPRVLQRSMITKTTKKGGAKWRVWRCNAGHNPAMSQPETASYALRKVAGEALGSEPGVEFTAES